MTTITAHAISLRTVPVFRESHSRRRMIGQAIELTLSDGTTETCQHAHTTKYDMFQCARSMKLRYAG